MSLLMSASGMPHMMGSRALRVDLIAPLTSRRQSFSLECTFLVAPNRGTVLCSGEADGQSRRTQNVEVGVPMISRQASKKVAARPHFPSYCFYVLPEAEGAVESDSKVLRRFFERNRYAVYVYSQLLIG